MTGLTLYARDSIQSANPIKPGTATIIGQIKKYDGVSTTLKITYWDAVTAKQNQEIVFIDSKGNFKTTFQLLHPTSTPSLQYGRTYFQMYLVPDETFYITINQNGSHIFTGTNGDINNQFFDLTVALRAKFKDETSQINTLFRNNTTDYQLFEKKDFLHIALEEINSSFHETNPSPLPLPQANCKFFAPFSDS